MSMPSNWAVDGRMRAASMSHMLSMVVITSHLVDVKMLGVVWNVRGCGNHPYPVQTSTSATLRLGLSVGMLG